MQRIPIGTNRRITTLDFSGDVPIRVDASDAESGLRGYDLTLIQDGITRNGAVRAEFGEVDGSWGWATHRKAESHGLTFMRARWYSAGVGRFVQADTVVPGGTSAQAFNRYAYAMNSPLQTADPSGHGLFEWIVLKSVQRLHQNDQRETWTDGEFVRASISPHPRNHRLLLHPVDHLYRERVSSAVFAPPKN